MSVSVNYNKNEQITILNMSSLRYSQEIEESFKNVVSNQVGQKMQWRL